MKVLFSVIIFSVFISCQGQEQGQNKIEIKKRKKNSYMELFTKVLKSQICFGADSDRGMECDLSMKPTSSESFEASIFIIDTILTKNGYKKLEEEKFDKKIKNIFGSFLFNTYSNQNILHFDININNPKCDTISFSDDKFLYAEGAEKTGYHIVKDKQIISNFYYLPELIDYQKKYPEIAKLEDKAYKYYDNIEKDSLEVTRWKDVKDLPKQRKFNQQLLISRNKYLFNDDQSQFAWLINNDEYFMKSLVTTFGYTEDKKLLKWVIENTELPLFYKYAKSEILDNLGRLLWTKDCNGNIRVHQNTLDILKELSPPENNLNIMYVAEYLTNNLEENQDLNDSQKAKIAAYLLYWGEQFKYDKRYDLNQMFMGHYYHYMDDGTYEKEFIKNNYYGLPKFKEWYEAAKKEKDCFNGGAHLEDDPQPLDYESRAKYIK